MPEPLHAPTLQPEGLTRSVQSTNASLCARGVQRGSGRLTISDDHRFARVHGWTSAWNRENRGTFCSMVYGSLGDFGRTHARASGFTGASTAVAPTPRGVNRETGSVMILALVFMLVGAVVIGGLATWATNDLIITTRFRNASQLLYAAGGATDAAIWSSRYTVHDTNPIGYPCPGTRPSVLINGQYIADWCITTPSVSISVTRQIAFSACVNPTPASSLSQNCTNPLLTAVVNFNEDAVGVNNQFIQYCTVLNPVNCGAGMTIISWKAQQAKGN